MAVGVGGLMTSKLSMPEFVRGVKRKKRFAIAGDMDTQI